MSYRNVIVGLDLESRDPQLLADVLRLLPGARITAFHAYDVPFEGTLQRAGVGMEEINRQRGEAIARALEQIREVTEAAGAAADRVVPLVERGDPARLIVDRARAIDADLIVVAPRRRSRVHALLRGSVARRVAAEADRDVLVLHPPPDRTH